MATPVGVGGRTASRRNLVSDAHIVALMRQHDVDAIWTTDRDFRRFDRVRLLDPRDLDGG